MRSAKERTAETARELLVLETTRQAARHPGTSTAFVSDGNIVLAAR